MASKKKKTKAKKTTKKKTKKAGKKAPAKKTKKLSAKKTKGKKLLAKKAAPKKAKAKVKTKTKAKTKKVAAPKAAAVKVKKATESKTITPALPIGTEVPALALENSDGFSVSLDDLANKNRHLVLYFYPKDDTPGCTKEACDFRDNLNRISDKGATIVGVSPDSKESHQNFANKYNINFTLLADPNHELAEKMGVWKSKQFMGNSYMGVERSTFLFTDGKLTKVWSPVKVEGHVDEVIDALENNA